MVDNVKNQLSQEIAEVSEETLTTLDSSEVSEAEEFAQKLMIRAASLTGVKISRDSFLRTEVKKHCPQVDADLAVSTTPIQAGVSPEELDKIALQVIDFETKKCAALSFAAGVPGGIALVGTVPADLAQYFAHVMRVEQKLAYLYGWQSFLNEEDEVDDETIMQLVALMGIMLQVGGVSNSITKFAINTAQQGVAKHIQKQALTKTFFYSPMKKVLRVVGVNVTKQTFSKTVSKVVPVIGGVISGGITYASFKPGAERLRKYLRSLPTSGINEEEHPDIATIEEEKRKEEREKAIAEVKTAGAKALDSAGEMVSSGAAAAASAAADVAQQAGSAFADAASSAGKAFGNALGSLGSKLKKK